MHFKMEANEGSDIKIENLRRLEKALNRAADYMEIQTRPEDAAIFIGTTRSGKSSLINYLIGNKLIGVKVSPYKPVALKKADNSPGPEIGIGATSETIIPSRWVSAKFPELGIWDSPGFDDNRGVVQDITNAFYINELFKNIKSAKIVLVTDINDIASDSIRQFLTLLNSVEGILKEKMRECFSSIGVIFTKVPDSLYDNQVDKNLISGLLKEQLLSSSAIDISESAKEFIEHLIKHNGAVGFFRKAGKGEITDAAIDSGIIEAIHNINGVDEKILKNVSPSIAHASKVFLFEVREQLSSMQVFNQLQTLVAYIFEKKLNIIENMKNSGIAHEILVELAKKLSVTKANMKKTLASVTSFHEKIAEVQMIDTSIRKLIDEHKLLQKAEFMEFIDKLLNLKESRHFDINLQSIILTAVSKVDALLIWIKMQLGEINQKEAEAEEFKAREACKEEIKQLKRDLEIVKDHNNNVKKEMGLFGRIGCVIDECLEKIESLFS